MATIWFASALSIVMILIFSVKGHCAKITVYPDEQIGKLSPMLYGQFLEHIYSSVVGGLWAEMVQDRSFEMMPRGQVNADIDSVIGSWVAADGVLSNETSDTPGISVFGDAGWQDYDYTFEFQKEGGAEGILIPFTYTNRDNFYWWNIGGWGNLRSAVECNDKGVKQVVKEFDSVGKTVATGQWYKVKISCRGSQFSFYLDGVQAGQMQNSTHTAGKVGIGVFATRVKTRNLRVTAPDGRLMMAPDLKTTRTVGLSSVWSIAKSVDVSYVGLSSEKLNGSRSCEVDTCKVAGSAYHSQ